MRALRVLIIDDSTDDAFLILQELKSSGYKPISERVENPEDTKKALEQKKWDIIISDYSMPKFTGIEALEIFKEFNMGIPFIILSGFIGEETAVAAMKSGASDYIMKKDIKKLGPTVKRELSAARGRKKLEKAEKNLALAYKDLKSLEELKTEIISNVSHELKTPITIALRSLELALLEDETLSKDEKIHTAIGALKRQQRIVENLIIVSTIYHRDFKPGLSREDLPSLISEALDSLDDIARDRKVKIKTTIEEKLPPINLDRDIMLHVLMNIIENAIKFNIDGGKVEIGLEKKNNFAQVTITDQGIGLKKKHLKKIFLPLTQLDTSTKRRYSGTGIGLAVAKHIIEIHR